MEAGKFQINVAIVTNTVGNHFTTSVTCFTLYTGFQEETHTRSHDHYLVLAQCSGGTDQLPPTLHRVRCTVVQLQNDQSLCIIIIDDAALKMKAWMAVSLSFNLLIHQTG